jgi:molybdopterin converting factor small subunit
MSEKGPSIRRLKRGRIKVVFLLGFRELTGERSAIVEAENLSEVIEQLSRKYGKELREALIDDDELSRLSVVFVNGKRVTGKPREIHLRDGDEVVFSTAYGGGFSQWPC